jgi:hypothetical protein
MADAPNKTAINHSRINPVTRDSKVNKDTTEADLNKLTRGVYLPRMAWIRMRP